MSNESLVRDNLMLKKNQISKQWIQLWDAPIPFPICEFHQVHQTQACGTTCPKLLLIHYSLHNWDRLGNGIPPTVCLHGLNGSKLLFAEFVTVAETYYPHIPLVTVDLLGHGLSSCPTNRKYNLDLFVDQLDTLFSAIGLETTQVTLLGFSLGGAVAVGFADRHPELIVKLILISPAGFIPFQKKAKKKLVPKDEKKDTEHIPRDPCRISENGGRLSISSQDSSSSTSSMAEEFHGISPHVKLIKWVPACILNPIAKLIFRVAFQNRGELVGEHQVQMNRLVWQSFAKKGTVEATMSIVKNFPLFNMGKVYERVKASVVGQSVPVLLIWGDQDRVNPFNQCSAKVQSYFKNSFILKIEGAGHVVIGEQPSLIISSMISFLQAPEDFSFT